MALYGVLGDIHGNREALHSALTALAAEGIDRLICLGDIVGYNADPDQCATLIRERNALAIAGNHDLISLGRLGFERCSNKAMYSLKRTRRSLEKETVQYLQGLPGHLILEGEVVLIHGGVRDVQEYMVTEPQVWRNAQYAKLDFPSGRLFLFGHTHDQRLFEVRADGVSPIAPAAELTLRRDCIYFINPGSIDAARKPPHKPGTPKFAEWAVLDTNSRKISFRRAPYDHTAAETKAVQSGYRIGLWTDRAYSFSKRVEGAWRRFGFAR